MKATDPARSLGGAGGLAILCVIWFVAFGSITQASPFRSITLTWSDDPRTTQTISWQTEADAPDGYVQYTVLQDRQAFFPARTIEAGTRLLATNMGTVRIHTATLRGLEPGTRYRYRVGSEGYWSEIQQFATAPPAARPYSVLVFGDSQSINYATWGDTVRQAYAANPQAAFFINVGDLVDVGQDYRQWEQWFNAARGVIDAIPAMPVAGNHETYTPERRFSLPLYFTAQFAVPDNGPAELERQAYSFDYGDTHFVMLDTQAGEEARFVPDLLERQQQWLERDLAATNKRWKLVFMHRSPYNNRGAGSNEQVRDAFVPVFDRLAVDAVFTGHDHVYARTYPLRGGEPVAAGEGTIYVATGRSGSKSYRDATDKWWNDRFHNPLEEPNYLVLEIKSDELIVRAFRQSGVLLDEWKIVKPERGRVDLAG